MFDTTYVFETRAEAESFRAMLFASNAASAKYDIYHVFKQDMKTAAEVFNDLDF